MARIGENIYKRKDKRWEGRYKKGVDANGKTKLGYVYGYSYKEVRQKLYPLKLKYLDQIKVGNISALSLKEWGFLYLKKAKIKASTYASYQHKLQHYILPHLGDCGLNEVTTEQLQSLIASWQALSLSASSIKTTFSFLRTLFNQAVKRGGLRENPCHEVELPKSDQVKVRSLNQMEETQLRNAAKAADIRKGAFVLITLETGIRIGEAAALRWADIDFEQELIHINQTFQRVTAPIGSTHKTTLLYTEPKTKSSKRVIPMTDLVKDLLKDLKEKACHEFVFSEKDKPREPRLLTYHFKKICEAAQVGHLHFHQLRHNFATRCLERSADIVSVSALLGHSSVKMTLDIYADSHVEQQRKIIQTFNQSA